MAKECLNQSNVMGLIVNLRGAQVSKLMHGGSVGQRAGDQGSDPMCREVSVGVVREEVAGGCGAEAGGKAVGERENSLALTLAVHNERPADRVLDEVVVGMHLGDLAAPHAQFICETKHQGDSGVGRTYGPGNDLGFGWTRAG